MDVPNNNAHEHSSQEPSVSFDEEGNIIINKNTDISKKLMARRAIEAYEEKKRLEKELEDYFD